MGVSSAEFQRLLKKVADLEGVVAELRKQNGPRLLRPASTSGGASNWYIVADTVANLGVPSTAMVGFIESGAEAGEYIFPPWGTLNTDWKYISRWV